MESFREYLESQMLQDATINTHIKNMEEFGSVKKSQNLMIKKLEQQPTNSKKLSRANSLSKFLQFCGQPNNDIVDYIKLINEKIAEEANKKPLDTVSVAPTVKDLKKLMQSLYEKQSYREYCILFLLVNYTVRNKDIIANIVKSVKETNNSENWLIVGKSQVKWLRNQYKTVSTYGPKKHIIKNVKFINAIKNVDFLLRPTDNADRTIKKITASLGGLTETKITKIIIQENNTVYGLKKISKNRGVDLVTLCENFT